MSFVERIFHPVIQAVERAFTPPGTGGQEAAAQQAASQQQQVKQAAAAPSLPAIPAAPPSPPTFSPGQSPGSKAVAKATPSVLGAAAVAGQQTAKKSLLGQ